MADVLESYIPFIRQVLFSPRVSFRNFSQSIIFHMSFNIYPGSEWGMFCVETATNTEITHPLQTRQGHVQEAARMTKIRKPLAMIHWWRRGYIEDDISYVWGIQGVCLIPLTGDGIANQTTCPSKNKLRLQRGY